MSLPESHSQTAPEDKAVRERFRARLAETLAQGRWQRLVLAKPRGGADGSGGAQRVLVRPLQLRGQACLQFVASHPTRDLTENLPVPQGLARVDALIDSHFRNAHLFTAEDETQLLLSKKGRPHLSVHKLAPEAANSAAAAAPASTGHDREKRRWIELSRPFLVELGVTNAQHQLVPAMARKWKQINKFVEVFAHALDASPLAKAQRLRVVDFGAGKAYLSFAVHDWLRHARGLEAEVLGVELRPDLVAQGNDVVARLGLQGMTLAQGDVRDWPASEGGHIDVMIALHACDTATDHAIHLGLKSGADIILCSPCCHKQLRPQLLSPHPLKSVFQHGIHAEQQAEMITDSLRALLLQAQGYDTQVFEFVTLEHTRKNKMILAVKRAAPAPAAAEAARAQVTELKQFFGVREQCLESLLQAEPVIATG
jgi:hypothetical protein